MQALRVAPGLAFDLDNTLHNATPHIFPHINRSMRQYIERHLGVDESRSNPYPPGLLDATAPRCSA
jgi:FMN phosphatase YigB (HAD superfamily)